MASDSLLLGGLRAAISTSGRATRSEFWGFMPFGLSLCVLTAFATSALNFTFMGIVLSVFVAAVPLLSMWWRRLQDVGVWGGHAFTPWFALFICILCVAAAYALQNEADEGFRRARDHLYGWAIAIDVLFKFVGGKWVAMLIALISLIVFIARFVFALSQAMLPSDPKTNKYGPNPNEVTQ